MQKYSLERRCFGGMQEIVFPIIACVDFRWGKSQNADIAPSEFNPIADLISGLGHFRF